MIIDLQVWYGSEEKKSELNHWNKLVTNFLNDFERKKMK